MMVESIVKSSSSSWTLKSSTSDDHSTVHDVEKVAEVPKKEPEAAVTSELTDYPEGGLRGWLAVAGSFIFQFSCFGYLNAFGVYNDYYVRTYLNEKYTSSEIGWIGSVQLLLIYSMGIVSGRAFDAGYFYHITIIATILFTFSLFMLSLTQPQQYYQVFLAQGLGNGIAMGLLYTPGLAVVSHYFKRRRAFVMGIAAAGTAVGGSIHPIMLNKLFYGSVGFHNGVRASAGFNLGLLIIAILFTKPRLPPKKHEGSLLENLRTFLREPAYLITILGTIFAAMGFYYPLFSLQLYAIEHGVNSTFAFYLLTILNATSLFGRVISNLAVNKYGVMNTMLLCTIGAAITVFSELAVKNLVGIIFFSIVFGFFVGSYAGLLGPMLSAQARNDTEIGARIGICFMFTGIGALVGNPIGGALVTSSYIWWRAIVFSGVFLTLGAMCFIGARLMFAKKKGTAFV
ncbi:hypothetical protein AX15_005570 [Amanita polypyramis BW_CC]|nr:hypothetical protein AX15_005570 [Amanita polypyramis BW_CC]